MAGEIIFDVATWELDVVELHTALATVFAAGWLLAGMLTRLVEPLAGLYAGEGIVHTLRMAPSRALMPAVG